MAEPWPNPHAAWADVAVALRTVAAQPGPSRPRASDPGFRPIRQIIHALWKSQRLSEDGAAEALALSLVVPSWTTPDGVPAEDIFSRCHLVLDNLGDSSRDA